MSQTVYMILCIKCKSEFDQGDTNRRFCLLCRHTKDEAQRKRARDIREIKRHQAKVNPIYYDRICPVCETEFRTKFNSKKYCNQSCKLRKKLSPIQLDNVQANLTRTEERIVNINLTYEKKMNKLEDQLDYMNYELEKQRQKYLTKLAFLKKVMNK